MTMKKRAVEVTARLVIGYFYEVVFMLVLERVRLRISL
jgi:hypothetical protein